MKNLIVGVIVIAFFLTSCSDSEEEATGRTFESDLSSLVTNNITIGKSEKEFSISLSESDVNKLLEKHSMTLESEDDYLALMEQLRTLGTDQLPDGKNLKSGATEVLADAVFGPLVFDCTYLNNQISVNSSQGCSCPFGAVRYMAKSGSCNTGLVFGYGQNVSAWAGYSQCQGGYY